MEKRKVVEGGLGNAALGKQTEASVERRFHDALFLEHVRESPVTHHLDKAVALANRVCDPWAHKCCIRHRGLVHVAGVEFAPDQRHARVGGSADLVVNFLDGAADHLIPRDSLMRAKNILGPIVPINVS